MLLRCAQPQESGDHAVRVLERRAPRIPGRRRRGFAGFAPRRCARCQQRGRGYTGDAHQRHAPRSRAPCAPDWRSAGVPPSGGGLAGSGRYRAGFGAHHHASRCPGYRRERSGAATRPRTICPWGIGERGTGSHGERPHPVGDRVPPDRGGHAPPLEPATVGPGRAGPGGRGMGVTGVQPRGTRPRGGMGVVSPGRSTIPGKKRRSPALRGRARRGCGCSWERGGRECGGRERGARIAPYPATGGVRRTARAAPRKPGGAGDRAGGAVPEGLRMRNARPASTGPRGSPWVL